MVSGEDFPKRKPLRRLFAIATFCVDGIREFLRSRCQRDDLWRWFQHGFSTFLVDFSGDF